VLADHFESLERVHEERFELTHGALRRVAREAVGRFLDCGLLEHGFARVQCATCRAEFLIAFRCKGRGFCPSCHARRWAEWSLWLEEHLLAPVPHRQGVLTLPKRLRAYFLYDRRRLGRLSQVASRTLRDYVQAALGEYHAVPGVIACVQTFGSLAHLTARTAPTPACTDSPRSSSSRAGWIPCPSATRCGCATAAPAPPGGEWGGTGAG
jgi:hypothetical protein